MAALRRLAAVFLLVSLPVAAANRCALPGGRILYTDESCESVGGKLDRAMKSEISVVPLPPAPAQRAGKKAAARKSEPRRLPGGMPVLGFCYDPKDAREEMVHSEVEAAIRNAVALWNAGCQVHFDFIGSCEAAERYEKQVDFRVRWVSFPASMQIREGAPYRDHAIAAASIAFGIGLNRDIAVHKFARQ